MKLFELIGYIKRGKNRLRVFTELDKPMLPSELTKNIYGKISNTHFNIISRALSELNNKGLVEIINPNDKTGRIYQKTKLGERISRKIKDFDNKK